MIRRSKGAAGLPAPVRCRPCRVRHGRVVFLPVCRRFRLFCRVGILSRPAAVGRAGLAMLLAIGKLGKGRLCGSCQRQAALSSAAAAFLCAACSLSCAILPIGATGFRFRFLFSGCRYRSRGLGKNLCRHVGRAAFVGQPGPPAWQKGAGRAAPAQHGSGAQENKKPNLFLRKKRFGAGR